MPRNKEMGNKLKEALKASGVAPNFKKESGGKAGWGKDRSNSKGTSPSKTNIKGLPSNKKKYKPSKKMRPAGRQKSPVRPEPSFSYEAYRSAYGPTLEEQRSHVERADKGVQKTIIRPKKDVAFSRSMIFERKLEGSFRTVIDESRCKTQISPDEDDEVHLVIGLDVGTSTTKVVIGDPDHRKFYAVPLSAGSKNAYIVATSIIKVDGGKIIVDTGEGIDVQRDIKLNLMYKKSGLAVIDMAGYIAQIVRRSISWFIDEHFDTYRGRRIFWTMSVGSPTDSARKEELEKPFRLAAIAGAQAALSEGAITGGRAKSVIEAVEADIEHLEATGSVSRFNELGSDAGVVVVVPEIAAQVVGLYRSRRWDDHKPISFLMDVGGGTVDAAVFSLVDAGQEGKELAFCAYSCNVSDLGVLNLHHDRVNWLLENIPDNLPCRDETVLYLNGLKQFDGALSPVPESINEYVNHIEIVSGQDNIDPDSSYARQLSREVYEKVLNEAKRVNERDSAWVNLRALVCGGGGRSKLYRDFVSKVSSASSFNLQAESLEKPVNLQAPGLPAGEYDRLSVAYGLAQGTQWEYRWPGSIQRTEYGRRNAQGNFVSQDML